MTAFIHRMCLFAFLLLAGITFSSAAHAYTATGTLPSALQVEVPGSNWDTVVADATAQSTPATPPGSPNPAPGGTPIYHSTQLEETSFEGDFTADVNTTSLAIFSDDGCDVWIGPDAADMTKVWSGRDQTQTLEVLSTSLHRLPTTLNPGQTYHIKIDYSNVVYNGDGDIDGVTLFTWSDPLIVNLDLSNIDGGTAVTEVESSGPIFASLDPSSTPPQSTATCQVLDVEWSWDFGDVQYSADDINWDIPPADAVYNMTIDNAGSPTADFNMTLPIDGYWGVALIATVTYYTTCGDISATGVDYVGQPTNGTSASSNIGGINSQSMLHTASFVPPLWTRSYIMPNTGNVRAAPPRQTKAGGGTSGPTVKITAPDLDQTFHKDQITHQPVADSNADGGLHQTVKQDSVLYTAVPAGAWASNSSYFYHAVVGTTTSGSHSLPGTFDLTISPQDNPDFFLVNYGSAQYGTNEHIHVTCTDAQSGAVKTGNYWVQWHDYLEKTGQERASLNKKTDVDDNGVVDQLTEWLRGGGPEYPLIEEQRPKEYHIGAGLEVGGGIAALFGQRGEAISKALEILGHLADANGDMTWNSNDVPQGRVRNDSSLWDTVEHNADLQANCTPEVRALLPDVDADGYYGYTLTDMQYRLVTHYKYRTWPADAYSISGFLASTIGYVNSPQYVAEEPYYRLHISQPTTGGGG